jgi:hypothetical protein
MSCTTSCCTECWGRSDATDDAATTRLAFGERSAAFEATVRRRRS